MDDFSGHIIKINANARQALQQLNDLDESWSRTLFVINNDKKLIGTITDGDIRRGLLNGKEISDMVHVYMNQKFKFFTEDDMNPRRIKEIREANIRLVPLLNDNGTIIKILDLEILRTIIPASALLMAGGRGERLRPLTDVVPKPMLKINGKPILEHNIDRLIRYGINDFHISVKYLANQIMDYFGDGSAKGVSIKYITEDQPLGTIGSFKNMVGLCNEDVLVMNSDIVCNIDLESFYEFYKNAKVLMSVASIPYQIQVPYGVLELEEDHKVVSLTEKPTYTYYSNAGIYFVQSRITEYIPGNTFFNATDLMEKLINDKMKVVHYPILNYWMDIGRLQDYYKVQEEIKHIKF